MQKKSLILVSGGMDSGVLCSIAAQTKDELYFLHLNYHNKTHIKELSCFRKLCTHFNIPAERQKIIDLAFLKDIGSSSLTDSSIEVSDFSEISLQGEIPSSYVPFRNSIILSLAVSWAESIGIRSIYIGANEEDSPGYPDCRQSYYDCFNQLIKQGTKEGDIQILTPLISLMKKEIVEQGNQLHTPFEHTWSCYKEADIACGKCDSCVLRLKGFAQNDLKDPIDYQKD
ncbi:7-cyano-7-deazaguanine synthase QueC [Bacteriovoracaceae bacterium]|nr:7-cyano-7-deazaguanine synthase QueC [Bacteriovoracaceae bacterium]